MTKKEITSLIERACELTAQIKPLEKELEEIKAKLKSENLEDGNYPCSKGVLQVSTKTENILDPQKTYKLLKQNFWEVCSVSITKVKNFASLTQIVGLVKETKTTKAYTFKIKE